MKRVLHFLLFSVLIFAGGINFSARSACSFSPNLLVQFWDSCSNTSHSLNGYATFNSCYKYQWKVNNNVVGTDRILHYPVFNNGTYNVCLSVIDTCHNCDTVICSARTYNCFTTVPVCNWTPPNLYAMIWDSCTNTNKTLYGYASFNACYKYKWTVNGNIAGTTRQLTYPVSQNGTYNVCLTVTDSCKNCDTVICSTRVIQCIPNTQPCSWGPATQYVQFWDTCTSTVRSITGYATFNSCYKYKWTVNGNVAGTDRILHYPVNPNGPTTYNVCLTVSDTCRHCDTTFCSARVFTCVTNPPCNFAQPNLYTNIWDSCTSTTKAIYGYATFNSCFKYIWKINNIVVGTTRQLTYPVSQNGTYVVCLSVIDSCKNCDTVICSTRQISCIAPEPCHWYPNNFYVSFRDSCTNTNRSINANTPINSCYKYLWKVNGVPVATTSSLHYPVTQNGTYSVCVTVTDTCKHCDTTICNLRYFSCIPAQACQWGPATQYVQFSDSCTNSRRSVNGYAYYNSCYKYQWKVNNVIVGTTRTLTYIVPTNGTYVVCLTITDTCRHCDTTICSTRVINCIPATNCNWSTISQYVLFWDSCTTVNHSLNGYAIYNSCYKYIWKVNGHIVGTTRQLNYPITQNGTYSVCLYVTDTCKNCDTSFCSTRTINCFPVTEPCHWSTLHPNMAFWDTCTTTKRSVNAYISFNNPGCYKYLWKVNGQVAGTSNILHYPVYNNGTYIVCVTVTDTCRHCDTTFCSTRVLSCSNTNTCTWSPTSLYVSIWDSCSNTNKSVNGYATFGSCYKYMWKVNGETVATTRTMNFPVSTNGTYVVCLTVTDTCRHCDTTICSTRVINCLPSNVPCNWSSRYPYTYFWDTCITTKKSVNGYIAFNSNISCFKFTWKVNNVIVGHDRTLHYPVTANGTYNVCVTVTDTCAHCDTTICSIRQLNCNPTNVPCNWSSRNPYTYFWDTCTTTKKSLNGYIAFNNSTGNSNCFKYQWKVNGAVVGTGRTLNYPVTANGTYVVCVSVIDTCNHCDTSICSTRVLMCTPNTSTCNWLSEHPYVRYWDSCAGLIYKYSLNGYIVFNSSRMNCFKYQWKVNGHLAGTDRWLYYPVTENGTYQVCVTVTDTCKHCDTTFCSTRYITCVTQLQQNNESGLRIYANPTSGLISVDWMADPVQYIISNNAGQLIQTGQLLNGTQLIDLSGFPNGIYLFKVQGSEGILTRKISLQKQ